MEDIEEASAPDTNKDKMVNGDMLQVSLGFSNAYGGSIRNIAWHGGAQVRVFRYKKYMSSFFLFFVTKIIIC